jgi:hypothetical protein
MILAFIEKIDQKSGSQENTPDEVKEHHPEPGNLTGSNEAVDQKLLLIREKIEKERFERELIARSGAKYAGK